MEDKTVLVNNGYKVEITTDYQPKIEGNLVIYQPDNLSLDVFYSARVIDVEPWGRSTFTMVILDSLLSSAEPCAVLEGDVLTVLLFNSILRVNLCTKTILQCVDCENTGGLEQICPIYGGYIIKGECDIFRYDNTLNLIWNFSARDVIVTRNDDKAFWVAGNEIHCRDWQGWHYTLGINGKTISEVLEYPSEN